MNLDYLETNLTALYMHEETKQWVREMAKADGLSVSFFIHNLVYKEYAHRKKVRKYFEANQPQEPTS